jgi:hypothetical protein
VRLFLALATAVFLVNFAPVKAGDGPDWLNEKSEAPRGVVSNDAAMVRKDASATELLMAADKALKSDKTDLALTLIKKSLKLNNDDLDAHMSYAIALEKKLNKQKAEDPETFNQCVTEWLAVLRNKYGEEKAETYHGVGIPGINGRFFADEERQGPARSHLLKLTGFAPKPWETDAKFLAKVLRRGEAAVTGQVVHDPNPGEKDPKDPKDPQSASSEKDKQPH